MTAIGTAPRGAVLVALLLAGAAAAQPPDPVRAAVPGRVAAWVRADLTSATGREWAVAYHLLERRVCDGEFNGTWRLAVVSSTGNRVIDHRFSRSYCGGGLMWLRAGRLTDGRHPEVAVDLSVTPSIGHQARLFRVEGQRLRLLRTFNADGIRLADRSGDGRPEFVLRWHHPARAPDRRTAEQVWRWDDGRYRLWRVRR
jgi:hypothetical protein